MMIVHHVFRHPRRSAMKKTTALGLFLLLPLLCQVSEAATGDAPLKRRNGIMVEAKGRGVYVFDGDIKAGVSTCDPRCISLWPPVYAAADARPHGPFIVIATTNGRKMWAYKGKPVYRWLADKKRGDAGGDGVSGVWHVIRLTAADANDVAPYSAAER